MDSRDDSPIRTHQAVSTLAGAIVASLVLLAGSSAFAVDGYSTRKGPFFGIGLGGGIGAVDMADGEGEAGFEDGRLPGFSFNATVGGGVNEHVVLGAQFDGWIRTVKRGSRELGQRHWNFLALGDFYLFKGFYLEAGAGLAYAAFDAEQNDTQIEEYREMGFATHGGAGFEFFLNGTYAAGVNVSYTRHFYSSANFDTFTGGISFRWY